jgi:formylglycine-generating enzyme required for sulfatase activity
MPKESNAEQEIHTGGGSAINGGVRTEGGDFVGRDKIQAGTYIKRATIIQQLEKQESTGEEPAPGEAPYKGLQYFDIGDAGLFFGREAQAAQLVRRLRDLLSADELRFLAVVGASGSGKSSLARAGLAAALASGEALADGTLPPQGAVGWPQHIITPGNHPLESLAASLTRASESVSATATLIDDLRADERSLHLYARKLLSQGTGGGEQLFLLVDQFEELFTLCRDEDERTAFIQALLNAAGSPGGPVVVVLTLRADFYTHCARYEGLRAALARQQEYIGAMNAEELRRAIEAPAEGGGWELKPGLVDLMLRDAGAEPGALPLLSHALLETWKRRQGKRLTLAGYHAAGGVRGAIAHTADRVYGALTPDEQVIAREIFLRLTELGEGTQDTRRRAELDELLRIATDRQRARRVLAALADAEARLVVTGETYAEVAHEALIREWPALRGWLEAAREDLLLGRRLTEAARAWEALERDLGDLYRGARLAQALDWAHGHDREMSPLEREFLEASQAEQARAGRARRLRWAGLTALVALLGVVITPALTSQLTRLIYRPLPMAWEDIDAEEFLMGSPEGDQNADEDEFPQHQVYLDAYQIMAYEVTNRQYRQCVRSGVCSTPANTRYDTDEYADHPVTNVSWSMAGTFCHWAGARLPTEAEWEAAARGGLPGKQYPWGDETPVCEPGAPNGANFSECSGDTMPVGSFSPNKYSLYDMAGNVWEWVADWYASDYYANSPAENPPGPESGDYLVLRGGSWYGDALFLRVADRRWFVPGSTYNGLGFRCARSP